MKIVFFFFLVYTTVFGRFNSGPPAAGFFSRSACTAFTSFPSLIQSVAEGNFRLDSIKMFPLAATAIESTEVITKR